MTPAQLLFCLKCLLCGAVVQQEKSPQQESVFVTVNIGDNLTLDCPNDGMFSKYYWFKQSLGETPRLMSAIYRGTKTVFEGEFKNDTHFKMDTDGNKNNINIYNVQLSDSATYFCTMGHFNFLKSIIVLVKGLDLNTKAEVLQSPHEDTEPGRSVTLNCSVHTGTCDGPHRVYWFKQSEESAAGVLYSHGGSSDQCGRNTDSQTNSCVYNLPIHNVSPEQTGTYYCAVASCGQVLFGNGTRINIKTGVNSIIYVLTGALVFTSVLVVVLAFSLCVIKKKYSSLSTELKYQSRTSVVGQGPEVDHLHYAAVSINPSSRRQRNIAQTDCVYSDVHQHN